MPRYQRAFLQGSPLHIVQRGHDRKAVFACNDDYVEYLNNLGEQLALRRIKLVAYCLMTKHVHLLVEPTVDGDTISQLMRVVAGRQTRYVNRLERRTGTLWEGWFKCSLVDRNEYLVACVRYIEMNPVKAGMVENPGDYEWSSYRERTGIADARVGVACLPENDQAELARCYGDPSEVNLEPRCDNGDVDRLIQTALARNQLSGASHFHAEIERKLERRLSSLPPGRPRRVGDEK